MSTNTGNIMQDTADQEALAAIYQQLQQGIQPLTQEELHRQMSRKKGLLSPGRKRGLDLSSGQERGLNMSFNKREVPELTELDIPFDRRQQLPYHRRGLVFSFDRRYQ